MEQSGEGPSHRNAQACGRNRTKLRVSEMPSVSAGALGWACRIAQQEVQGRVVMCTSVGHVWPFRLRNCPAPVSKVGPITALLWEVVITPLPRHSPGATRRLDSQQTQSMVASQQFRMMGELLSPAVVVVNFST